MGARRGGRIGLIVIVLIIFVLVAAVGVIFVLNLASGGSGTAGTATEVVPTAVPQTQIIVAKHDIRRGTRLTQDDVDAMNWPADIIPPNALIVGPTVEQPGLEQVDGMIARVDILTSQPVLSHMIASEKDLTLQASGSDAALLIPSGQVAVAFPLSRMAGVAYALRKGDHVDVMMSFRLINVDKDFQTSLPNNVGAVAALVTNASGGSATPEILIAGREENGPFGVKIMVIPSEDKQRPRQVTQLVIKNAIVMHIGDWPLTDTAESIVVTPAPASTEEATPAPEGANPTAEPPAAPDIITLVMSRQDALVLKYSLETGADIDFALRSALDNDVTDVATDSVTLQYLMDFYDIVEPPLLPIAQQPRIDQIVNPNGDFQQPQDSGGTTLPPS